MVKNDLAGDARGGFIPPHLKVLTAIRTWAHGEVNIININYNLNYFHKVIQVLFSNLLPNISMSTDSR